MINIFANEKKRLKENALRMSREGARAYAEKLEESLRVLSDFDARQVDDFEEYKRSLEKSGQAVCMLTTANGYQALIDPDGKVLATNIPNDKD